MQPCDGGSPTPWRSSKAALAGAAGGSLTGVAREGLAGAHDRDAAAGLRRGRAAALVALARPRQWVKNALVIAAPGAAGALGHDDVPVRVLTACAAFCLISAGVYALNDVRDYDEDRGHPRKCRRPVAAGELMPRDAVLFGAGWLAIGLIVCTIITPLLTLIGLAYVTLTLSYSWIWRHVPVLDLVALAAGFVLRAIAGGVAAPVGLSRWFVLVVTCAATFIAAGKRLSELLRAKAAGRRGRRVLESYSPRGLRAVAMASGAGSLLAYGVWALKLPAVDGVPWRLLTVIPFAVCVLRYALLLARGAGEAPEETMLGDRVLPLGGMAWLVLFAMSVHVST
ncbi:MAG: decaprenyl-phosphate phosphoribosyltransferase [Solirubrobacteraceae bacterium]